MIRPNLPRFVSEGHCHDIGGIQQQALRQRNGETVSYLFSDQNTASAGQLVFLEVNFREALPEKDNEKVRVVVSHLEGPVVKGGGGIGLEPSSKEAQVIAHVRVIDKYVHELEGEWRAVLIHDKDSEANKWTLIEFERISDLPEPIFHQQTQHHIPLLPIVSELPSSSSSSSSPPSLSLHHESILINGQEQEHHNLTPPFNAELHGASGFSVPRGSESEHSEYLFQEKLERKRSLELTGSGGVKRKKKSSNTPSGPINLSTDVLQKLQEFKNKHKDCDAIANWDISQYATPAGQTSM